MNVWGLICNHKIVSKRWRNQLIWMIVTEGSFFDVLLIYAPKNMKINFHLSLTQIYLLVKYVGSECNKNRMDI